MHGKHIRRIPHCRQVVNLVPARQLLQKPQQAVMLFPAGRAGERAQPVIGMGRGMGHGAAVAGDSRGVRRRRRCTNSKEMAAGVTPETREA